MSSHDATQAIIDRVADMIRERLPGNKPSASSPSCGSTTRVWHPRTSHTSTPSTCTAPRSAIGAWRRSRRRVAPGCGSTTHDSTSTAGIDAHGGGDARRRHAVPRVLALATSTLYSTSVTQIPLLHRKVEAVLRRTGFERASHDAKVLLTILENYPRELLQIGEDELYQTAMGILGLQERQRLRVFIRRERFGRYFSCLVFLPRDSR